MFYSRNKKKMYIPANSIFFYIKVVFEGVKNNIGMFSWCIDIFPDFSTEIYVENLKCIFSRCDSNVNSIHYRWWEMEKI